MTDRYRSGRRFPEPPPNLEPVTHYYLTELLRSLNDLEVDVPYLPVNKESFTVSITSENYNVSTSSTTQQLAEALGTLLLKLKDSGIIK